MTDDIIERLRQGIADRGAERLMDEAAAEIERLREEGVVELAKAMLEIERLLDVLKTIECHSIDHTDACRMAGKAREPKP